MIFAFHYTYEKKKRKHPLLNTVLNFSKGLGNIASLITSYYFLSSTSLKFYFASMLDKLLKFLLTEEGKWLGIEMWVYQCPGFFTKISSAE